MTIAGLTLTPEAALAIAVSLALVYLWADDAEETWRDWRTFRDARAFRAFLKAQLLFAAAIAFLLGTLATFLDADVIGPARLVGWAVRAGFLIIGGVIWFTRRRRSSRDG